MFYLFNQNNSGGSYELPFENVIVEANSADEANALATTVGVDFDSDDYCDCCGEYWTRLDDDDKWAMFSTLDELLSKNKFQFTFSVDFAKVVSAQGIYTLSENPNNPRCKGTTTKKTQCGLSLADCKYHN